MVTGYCRDAILFGWLVGYNEYITDEYGARAPVIVLRHCYYQLGAYDAMHPSLMLTHWSNVGYHAMVTNKGHVTSLVIINYAGATWRWLSAMVTQPHCQQACRLATNMYEDTWRFAVRNHVAIVRLAWLVKIAGHTSHSMAYH